MGILGSHWPSRLPKKSTMLKFYEYIGLCSPAILSFTNTKIAPSPSFCCTDVLCWPHCDSSAFPSDSICWLGYQFFTASRLVSLNVHMSIILHSWETCILSLVSFPPLSSPIFTWWSESSFLGHGSLAQFSTLLLLKLILLFHAVQSSITTFQRNKLLPQKWFSQ